MIHTNRTVTVGNLESTIDSPIILYRGDKEVEVEFAIVGNKFTFKNKGNVIESSNASSGQLVILTPYGGRLFSYRSECRDGKVSFTITRDMTDELREVGLYSMQIRLYDDSLNSRITLPVIPNGIEIREPIAAEEGSSVADDAIVGTSTVVDGYETMPFVGNRYNKTNWKTNDAITSGKLNKIENAIDVINTNTNNNTSYVNRVTNIADNNKTRIQNIESDIRVIDSRISNLTSLQEGSTTGDAELVDGRIGYDGNKYMCVGDSIRYQMADVYKVIDSFTGMRLKYDYEWTEGGYISADTGDVVLYNDWKYTDFIEIDEDITMLHFKTNSDSSLGYNAFYDSEKIFIKNINARGGDTNIPDNARYFRLSVQSSRNISVFNIIESILDDKEEIINDYIGLNKDAYEYRWIDGAYIDVDNNGVVAYNTTWKYTDFIQISEGVQYLEASTTSINGTNWNAFYDADRNYITNFNVAQSLIEVPTNAVYFRLSCYRAEDTKVLNRIIPLNDRITKEKEEIINDYIGLKIDAYRYSWINDGYIDAENNGVVAYDPDWKYTDFVQISEGAQYLEVSTTLLDGTNWNVFYDVDRNYITRFDVKQTLIEVPNNAVYFRLSCYYNGDTKVSNHIIPLNDRISRDEANDICNETVNTAIEKSFGYVEDYTYEWTRGGYIDTDNNGVLILSDTSWVYTDFIPLANHVRYLTSTSLLGTNYYNGFYDKDKVFIKKFNSNNDEIEIPSGAVYIRLSKAPEDEVVLKNKVIPVVEEIANTNNKHTQLYHAISDPYDLTWINGGYIDNLNGNVVEFYTWKYTDYVEIAEKAKYLELHTSEHNVNNHIYNAFYDAEKNFITRLAMGVGPVKIPNNAVYFRLSIDNKYDIEVFNVTSARYSIKGVVELNKDMEPFVIQALKGKPAKCGSQNKILSFVHFTDIHGNLKLWNRVVDYVNYYEDYVDFAIHTGDYAVTIRDTAKDLYSTGTKCVKPILNVVGNHDTYNANATVSDKPATKQIVCGNTDGWDVTFMDIADSMTYYKDYPDSKIRIIVLDNYYDVDEQCDWLDLRLREATIMGYHVITFMHEMTHPIINKLDTNFQTIEDFETYGGYKSFTKFDKVIGDWIADGGVHIANFAGHEHSDMIGYTQNGVLNMICQCATDDVSWVDGARILGTKTFDCFNLVSVETTTGVFKVVRIGNNSDHYLREKKVFAYDYINKKILTK